MRAVRLFLPVLAAILAVSILSCALTPPPLPADLARGPELGGPAPSPVSRVGPERVRSGNSLRPKDVCLGYSVSGRPIRALTFGGAGDCVLILGGIHGDEQVASRLVEQLAAHLRSNPADGAGRRIVLIARANPDGLAWGTRFNARGVDLNRNFPAENFEARPEHGRAPLSEPESRALLAAIARYGPSCVVSVHGPLNCVDPDGPPESTQLAQAMVAAGPLPLKDLPALPGSMGSYCGVDLGLKMITYELDRLALPAADASQYLGPHVEALLVAIRRGSHAGRRASVFGDVGDNALDQRAANAGR